jgi:5-methylcytosine-specific restriction enzyme subunit McrC
MEPLRVDTFLTKQLTDNGSIVVGQNATEPNSIPLTGSNKSLRDATDFLKLVENKISRALRDDENLVVQFGEEFGASRDQVLIEVRGESLTDTLTIDTGNIIGRVRVRRYPLLELRVSSRFGDAFLQHMVASAEGYLELEEMGAVPAAGESDWLLVFLWKIRLKQAFAAGLPKLYAANAERLGMVRGNLDLNAYLRVPADTGRYQCIYRQHSFDHEITRLVNAAFKHVSKSTVGGLVSDAQRIRDAFREACTDQRPNLRKRQPIRNPYFAPYEEVAELSRKILRDEGARLGDEDEISALLFDVSLLFEHHVRKLLLRAGLALAPRLRADAVKYPTGGSKRSLLPDIVVRGSRGTLILDAKFKRWEHWIRSEEGSRTDFFQIMSYAAAYRSRYQPTIGYGFVFPTRGEQEDIEEKFAEIDLNYHVFFIRVPDGSSGSEHFESAIKEYEGHLISSVKAAIC